VPAGHARHRHRRHRREGDAAGEGIADGADRHHRPDRAWPENRAEELRIELYEKVNALGIGAQGLGGLTTVLDVKVKDYPTHAANLPVAMIPNCAATRHAHFTSTAVAR
jgi:tartrate dehydratase alpha subunit/fumarate hydratase class I-like protein